MFPSVKSESAGLVFILLREAHTCEPVRGHKILCEAKVGNDLTGLDRAEQLDGNEISQASSKTCLKSDCLSCFSDYTLMQSDAST